MDDGLDLKISQQLGWDIEGKVRLNSLVCSGLGTGEGNMSAEQCARQMRLAYEVVVLGKALTQGGLAGAVRNHQFLIK